MFELLQWMKALVVGCLLPEYGSMRILCMLKLIVIVYVTCGFFMQIVKVKGGMILKD